ncbi:MAG TPA: hypothetical protein VGS02_11555 [Acidobacteriaceae bacterium]|nr:hypothetical protein [Acidobacteriaceae bacterium]
MASTQQAVHEPRAAVVRAAGDSVITVCAVAVLAMMISTMLHEGLGHALTALLTVAHSGVLSTVAWSSANDSKLIDAGGTIVNLIAAAVFWLLLRSARRGSAATRLFLLLGCAFNSFAGTGYFFFSGLTNFGDWAAVIQGLQPQALWRVLLVLGGVLGYWGALVIAGTSLIEYVGLPRTQRGRILRITLAAYLSAVALACIAASFNPDGIRLVFVSALPATAGAGSGLLYMQFYARRNVQPAGNVEPINRSFAWMAVSVACVVPYIFVLGRGITLTR